MPTPLVPRYAALRGGRAHLTPTARSTSRSTWTRSTRWSTSCKAQGIEAIASRFLHSYRNPAHERRVADARIQERAPEICVCRSRRTWCREIREYERTSTTIANVYVGPLVERYLDELRKRWLRIGVRRPFFIMLSAAASAPSRPPPASRSA